MRSELFFIIENRNNKEKGIDFNKINKTPVCKTIKDIGGESPQLSSHRSNSNFNKYDKVIIKEKGPSQDYKSIHMPLVKRSKAAKSNSKIKNDISK